MKQTEEEEPTALTKALRALYKALNHEPGIEAGPSSIKAAM
jgi:hypothetical protein